MQEANKISSVLAKDQQGHSQQGLRLLNLHSIQKPAPEGALVITGTNNAII